MLGLTTTATIWFVGSIEMGIGGGYYLTSIAGTGLALAILVLFRKIPRSYHTVRTYHIIVAAEDQAVRELTPILDLLV